MKWMAISLGAIGLAVGAFAGAFAVSNPGGGQNVRQIVATTQSRAGAVAPSPVAKPVSATKKPVAKKPAAKKPAAKKPATKNPACGNDSSDPTGDDGSCAAANENDNQAGDSAAGDTRDEQAGDNEPDESDNGD